MDFTTISFSKGNLLHWVYITLEECKQKIYSATISIQIPAGFSDNSYLKGKEIPCIYVEMEISWPY
jgi:hypothetical protein